MKNKKWFLSYLWKSTAYGSDWTPVHEIIDEHPISWLQNLITEDLICGKVIRNIYSIQFYCEIKESELGRFDFTNIKDNDGEICPLFPKAYEQPEKQQAAKEADNA